MRTWGSSSRSIDCAVWRRRDSPTDCVGSTSVARTQYPGGSRPGSVAARPPCRVKHPGGFELRSAARDLQPIDDAARPGNEAPRRLGCEGTVALERFDLIYERLELVDSRLGLTGIELGLHLIELGEQTIHRIPRSG